MSCRISSTFGARYDPVKKDFSTQFHKGVDFACPPGTPVASAEAGRVIKSRFQTVEGNYIAIAGASGMTERYFHGSRLVFSSDPQMGPHPDVASGQLVLVSGNTGARTTGPHVHFQVEAKAGQPVDPVPLFCGGAPPSPPSVLDPPGAPASAPERSNDAQTAARSYEAPINSPDLPASIEGSFFSIIEDLIAARASNPDYIKQLASLTETRLYAEVAYLEAVSLKLKFEIVKKRERIQAMMSLLQVLRTEQALTAQLEAQGKAASVAVR